MSSVHFTPTPALANPPPQEGVRLDSSEDFDLESVTRLLGKHIARVLVL